VADAEDRDSKTELATEKKITDAREKGNFPVSRELLSLGVLLGALLGFGYFAPRHGATLFISLASSLDHSSDISIKNTDDVWKVLAYLLVPAFEFIGLIVGLVAAFSIIINVAQVRPGLYPSRIKPELSRISVAKGLKRLFSIRSLVEFCKAMIKIGGIGAVSFLVIWHNLDVALDSFLKDPWVVPAIILHIAMLLLIFTTIILFIISLADFAFTRMDWARDLRMTKQEVRDEVKQTDGDPLVRSRLRQMAAKRARARMMTDVPDSAFVLVNPVHLAIAFRYIKGEDDAPVVVAKGQELVATAIRDLAESHEVPIIENVQLVRQLYDVVEIGQLIPSEFYHAIAEIIILINERKRDGSGLV